MAKPKIYEWDIEYNLADYPRYDIPRVRHALYHSYTCMVRSSNSVSAMRIGLNIIASELLKHPGWHLVAAWPKRKME